MVCVILIEYMFRVVALLIYIYIQHICGIQNINTNMFRVAPLAVV
jgi:hypothetical protein